MFVVNASSMSNLILNQMLSGLRARVRLKANLLVHFLLKVCVWKPRKWNIRSRSKGGHRGSSPTGDENAAGVVYAQHDQVGKIVV